MSLEDDYIRGLNDRHSDFLMEKMRAASASRWIQELSSEPGVAESVKLEGNETQLELLLKLVQASREIKEEGAVKG